MTKVDFLADLNNMSNHRILLWEALQLTTGNVIEFGCGFGSTEYLHQYCDFNTREFRSYENNFEWVQKIGGKFVKSYDDVNEPEMGVLFIDSAPGERRKIDLLKYKDIAKIIVIHDSEPKGWNSSDYGVREHFAGFKYAVDLPSPEPGGAWATMLSNHIDLSQCIGKKWEDYEITALQNQI